MSKQTPFGLYVHWPYCRRLCPYCDFNIYRHRGGAHDDLLRAILKDIEGHGARIDAPGPLHSLSFGGGTPSLLAPGQIKTVIETAARVFGFVAAPEISLEANPDVLDRAACAGFASAGINRISIGIQSLDDEELHFLGRDHSADDARRAVDAAQSAGVRVSADFIYDLPDQTMAAWTHGLEAALALDLAHYSFYGLTIAPGTAFGHQAKKGRLKRPSEDHSAALFAFTQKHAAKAGLPAYEVSNHASNTAEQSRHNLIYWQNGDWVGVGPGAHGRAHIQANRTALVTAPRPEDYCAVVKAQGWGVIENTVLSPEEVAMEALSMGLRLQAGLDLEALNSTTGFVLPQQNLQSLTDQGYLNTRDNILRVLPKGQALIDRLVLELLA